MCMYDLFIFHFVILVKIYYYSSVLIYTVLIYFVNIFSVTVRLAIFNRDFSLL